MIGERPAPLALTHRHLRRIFRSFAMCRLAAALPLVNFPPLRVERRRRRFAPPAATAFFRRRADLTPPTRPMAFANVVCVARSICPSPAKPILGMIGMLLSQQTPRTCEISQLILVVGCCRCRRRLELIVAAARAELAHRVTRRQALVRLD